MPTELPGPDIFDGLDALRDYCYRAAAKRGFHEKTSLVNDRFYFAPPGVDFDTDDEVVQDYLNLLGNRLMLIVGEVAEAHEEIRAGNSARKRYYTEGKPEGLPSELADILIRVMDLAGEHEIPIGEVVREKLLYNAQRPYRHGKKF